MKAQKSSSKTALKIVSATCMTIFSLLSTFMGTAAWFESVRVRDSQSNSFSIQGGSSIDILSCYAVRYDGTNEAIAFDVLHGNASIIMSEYDYIFTDRNVNTPLFLRMEIAGYDDTRDLTVTVPCTGAYMNSEENTIYPYLSNVVCAKFLYGLKSGNTIAVDDNHWSAVSVTGSSVTASYKGMLAQAADFTGEPYVLSQGKRNSITLTLDADEVFDDDFIVQRTNAKGETVDAVVVFLALDYYVYVDNEEPGNSVNLVSDYIESYNGALHSFSFQSDINSITLDNGGNES